MTTHTTRTSAPPPLITLVFACTLLTACEQNGTARTAPAVAGPLHDAANAGDTAEVKRLLDTGANVNAQDKNGLTPLHLTAMNGHTATSTALLTAGANVNAQDKNGLTPLHVAALAGHATTATALLAAGGQ